MLRILGGDTALCNGITRRELLRVGGLSLFGGMTIPHLLAAQEHRGENHLLGAAKSVILFNLLGGPSHMDMFDMKPLAPPEIRGEFQPIDTSLPGLQICEHLPNTAKWMHKASLIRTVSHTYDSHDPLVIMTGFTEGNAQLPTQPTYPPDIGAICQYLGLGPQDIPGAVCLPCYPGWGEGGRRGGPYGGFLGSQYDAMFSMCDPTFSHEPKRNNYEPVMPLGEPYLSGFDSQPGMTVNRFDGRRSLLSRLDEEFERTSQSAAQNRLNHFQRRAFDMLTTSKTRDAFDLSQEPDEVRDRYGRNLYGSSMLVARRLVEIGVPFISVHQEIFKHYGHSYDMHENNFGMLKNHNLPVLDQVYPALIQDLDERGLLDSTLVIVMGEMGRSPRVNGKAGRDHWPRCGFSLLTGGGVKSGTIHGVTDKQAAYPESGLTHPADLVATVYHLLGVDPHLLVKDRTGRPFPIARSGEPVFEVIA
ncbi:MAG: DUF1501 domain-containing protein [Planctomycetota bacterium]|nr:DUF1501 domain-containing protein [Planctomycetota bacterium]MDA1213708.1 DUF1501 domain-containing protein [Planctomycetota bacterium]